MLIPTKPISLPKLGKPSEEEVQDILDQRKLQVRAFVTDFLTLDEDSKTVEAALLYQDCLNLRNRLLVLMGEIRKLGVFTDSFAAALLLENSISLGSLVTGQKMIDKVYTLLDLIADIDSCNAEDLLKDEPDGGFYV